MRAPGNWSLSIGRWGGLGIRIHAFFVAFAVATLYLCWPAPSTEAAGNLLNVALAGLGLLFLSVLVHELSHWLVAHLLGVSNPTIVLGPLGGYTPWSFPESPRAWLLILCAGPAANLLLGLFCLIGLFLVEGSFRVIPLLNPLEPAWAEAPTTLAAQGLRIAVWINWFLFLVNLLPAFPFDGGGVVAAILNAARPQSIGRRGSETLFWVATLTAAVIMAFALYFWKHNDTALFPTSVALVLLAVILLVAARRDFEVLIPPVVTCAEPVKGGLPRKRHQPWGPLPTDGLADALTAPDIESAAAVSPAAPRRDVEAEAEEEQQVDTILARLHVQGWDSLTREERALLQRVSVRYRHRLGRPS